MAEDAGEGHGGGGRPRSQAVEEPAGRAGLLRSDAEGVVGLTLNRPDQYNALSRELLGLLQAELDAIKDDPEVRVIVITGTGQAFCAGHDLKEMRPSASATSSWSCSAPAAG